jgi:serine/threonine protein kinase
MFESLKLSDLPSKQCAILRRPSNTRPAVWVIKEKGVKAVVKDFSTGRFLFRNTMGRFLVWRESKAYRKLKNVRGVPALYRVLGGLALVIEKIPGRNLEELEDKVEIPACFFDALKDCVDRFHEKGIAHCDLKRSPNTLFGQDGLPYVIDWGASISESECRLYPLNLIYERFVSDDYKAIIKLKLRHAPGSVGPEEKERYQYRSGPERLIRAMRDRLRGLLKKLA